MIGTADCAQSEDRRVRIAKNDALTGLDSVDVDLEDDPGPTLTVTLLGHAPTDLALDANQVRISGGPGSLPVLVQTVAASPGQKDRDQRLKLTIKASDGHTLKDSGYKGTYSLEVIEVAADGQPTGRAHPSFDQFFASIEFHLTQGGATQKDCRRPGRLPPPRRPSPEVNYLAKDYGSFRQLILDRLSTVMPEWNDRSPADVGITLVEILAHIGDQLSYHQDAVATEAYLNTARQRISVRRHVRLVDYFMHEGCNARTFVCLKPETEPDEPGTVSDLGFATKPDKGRQIETQVIGGRQPRKNAGETFEPLIERALPLRFSANDLKAPASLAQSLNGKWADQLRKKLSDDFEVQQLPAPVAEIVREYEAQDDSADNLLELVMRQLPSLTARKSSTVKDPYGVTDGQLHDVLILSLRQAIIHVVAGFSAATTKKYVDLLRILFHEFVNAAIRSRLRTSTLQLLERYVPKGPPASSLEFALAEELNALLQSPFIRDVIFRPAQAGLKLPGWFPAPRKSLWEEFADISPDAKEQAIRLLSVLGKHLPMLIFAESEAGEKDFAPDQLDDAQLLRWNYQLLEDAFPWQLARRTQLAQGLRIYPAHNCMHFHTWGSRSFVLHAGSTSAALADELDTAKPSSSRVLANLQPGEVLVFEEVNSPVTGNPSDADITKRHAVRLTRVRFEYDPALADERHPDGRPIVRIWWRPEDALPFDLCVATVGPAHRNCELLTNIAVARGNVVPVDHGQRVPRQGATIDPIAVDADGLMRLCEDLGQVPRKEIRPQCEAESTPSEVTGMPSRYRPVLKERPLVFSEPLDTRLPATRFFAQDPRSALPVIELWSIPPAPGGCGPLFTPAQLQNPTTIAEKLLDDELDIFDRTLLGRLSPALRLEIAPTGTKDGNPNDNPPAKISLAELTRRLKTELPRLLRRWQPQRDLLASQDNDRHYVVEIDNDGFAHLRFGDGDAGRQPEAGEHFIADYRVGNAVDGNVGADTITHLQTRPDEWDGIKIDVTNPLAAQGGTAPEQIDRVRQIAPHAIRNRLKRAIIPDDYARLVNEYFSDRVQRAIAERRWTGSWEEILITVDPLGRVAPDPHLLEEIRGFLFRFRRIGHDVVVSPPIYVPLRIGIDVFVKQGFQLDHVREDVQLALSDGILPDGRPGFFHPDGLGFGQGVFLSRLIEAAGQVAGVEYVDVTTFERFFDGPNGELADGIIRLGPREIARMDGDTNYSERGELQLRLCEANK